MDAPRAAKSGSNMEFEHLPLAGARLICAAPILDERGSFERIVSAASLRREGLIASFPEISLSENDIEGTRRGMHFQRAPYEEAKIVRCIRGAIFDVIVDIRRESLTFGRAYGTVLKAGEHRSLYIPCGFAHGFQTLEAHSTVLYLISEPYSPEHAAGFSSDDPTLGIQWPGPPSRTSPRDRGLPLLRALTL